MRNERAGRGRERAPKRPEEHRADRVTQAYGQLRDSIIWGRLAPGARIVESEIADRLGVSRTPVSAAIRRLEQEGYILATGQGRQSRFTVAPLTEEDARELFSIIGEIEGLAARRAARRPDRERAALVADLNRINDELLRAAAESRPDHNRVFDLDQAFHRRCVEVAAGPRLLSLHDVVKPQCERYIRLYISALVDEIGISVDEHGDAIRAVHGGDADGAHTAIRINWHNATERLSRVIRALGERGTW